MQKSADLVAQNEVQKVEDLVTGKFANMSAEERY